MNSIRSFLVFLFLVFWGTSYSIESKCVFVGQNASNDLATTVFVLEVMGDNLDEYMYMNQDGEVYLKADKISIFSKDQFSKIVNVSEEKSLTSAMPSLLMSSIDKNSYGGDKNSSHRDDRFLVYCPEGHPNPPWNLVCQVCRRNLY